MKTLTVNWTCWRQTRDEDFVRLNLARCGCETNLFVLVLSVLPIIFLSFSKHVFDVFMFCEFLVCYVSVLVCSSMFSFIHFFHVFRFSCYLS